MSDPFRIRDRVADFDAVVADILARSSAARANLPNTLGVPYGPDETERLDLFFPDGPRRDLPVHVFVHGGYWRMFGRSDYSLIAETVTRAGAIAAVLDYALMPRVRMETIIAQMRRAHAFILGEIGSYGGDASRLSVSGHSAGAHLATYWFDVAAPAGVRSALLLGGIYDLAPLQSSFLANEIALTDLEVSSFSPLDHRHHRQTRVSLAYGEMETAPFAVQAAAFEALLAAQGVFCTRHSIAGRHHMDSVRDLGVPGSGAAALLTETIAASL